MKRNSGCERDGMTAGQLLILSNGHGEDAMGALLAGRLRRQGAQVVAFPLVGEGAAYRSAGIPLTGVQRVMPSGGFILEGTAAIWRDVKAGLLHLTWQQIRALRQMAGGVSLAVGVGDVYPLALNALFLRRPFVFIPTAKSDYIRGHYRWEAALMRATCQAVFPRDERTAASLATQGVPARYLGNLMMDALTFTGTRYGMEGRPVIALLPGSRAPEAYRNTIALLDVVEQLAGDGGAGQAEEEAAEGAAGQADDEVAEAAGGAAEQAAVEAEMSARRAAGMPLEQAAPHFVLALAGSLSQTELARLVRPAGWRWEASDAAAATRGIVGYLLHHTGSEQIEIVRGRFGDVLVSAELALGMSGTGNEQTAGLGVPVVAPIGAGPQFTAHFARDQKRLLGAAVEVVEGGPVAVAELVRTLLADPERRQAMGRAGRERMGEPGAAARITAEIMSLLRGSEACE
jgi:uncharacterized protein (TIGR03492 family)